MPTGGDYALSNVDDLCMLIYLLLYINININIWILFLKFYLFLFIYFYFFLNTIFFFIVPTATDDWATEEIEVVIKPKNGEHYHYGVYDEQHGVIEKVEKHLCHVILDQNNSSIQVPTKFLEPVCPDQKKQQVKVIIGKNRNQIGDLHSIDGNDGIVRMANASDIKCMNLKALAKYRPIS